MKVKDHRGNVLKLRTSDFMDEPFVDEYWKMAADLYEKVTYMNNIDIIINPGTERESILKVRPK